MILKRLRWNEFKSGDLVKLRDSKLAWEIVEFLGGADFTVGSSTGVDREVSFSEHYEATFVFSDACEEAAEKYHMDREAKLIWDACERHYGLQADSPLADFAKAVLAGDPSAQDAVRDILKL